jgi:hypothetical protein
MTTKSVLGTTATSGRTAIAALALPGVTTALPAATVSPRPTVAPGPLATVSPRPTVAPGPLATASLALRAAATSTGTATVALALRAAADLIAARGVKEGLARSRV